MREDGNVVAIRSHVRVAPSQPVVETAVGAEAGVALVVGIRRVVVFEVAGESSTVSQTDNGGTKSPNLRRYRISLVRRDGIDVAETTPRRVGDRIRMALGIIHRALIVVHGVAGIDLGCTDVGNIRAAVHVLSTQFDTYTQGAHLLGKAGLKIFFSGPRQPLSLSSPGGPATPSSPEAKKMDTP